MGGGEFPPQEPKNPIPPRQKMYVLLILPQGKICRQKAAKFLNLCSKMAKNWPLKAAEKINIFL